MTRGQLPIAKLCPKVVLKHLTIGPRWKREAMRTSAGRAKTHVDRDRAFQIMAIGPFPIAKRVSESRLQQSDDVFEVEAHGYACERGGYTDTRRPRPRFSNFGDGLCLW